MVLLKNNFDTGPDGTNITLANSDDIPGNNAFDYLEDSTASGNLLQYKSAAGLNRPTATHVMRACTGATSASQIVAWYSVGSVGAPKAQFWIRFYIYFVALPVNAISPVFFSYYDIDLVQNRGAIGVFSSDSSGRLFTENFDGSANVQTSATIVTGQWFRVEARFQCSTTTGNGEVRYFTDADSDAPAETLSFSNWNLGGATADYWSWGWPSADANLPDIYISGLAFSDTDWIGPAPFKAKGVPGILTNPIAVHSATR